MINLPIDLVSPLKNPLVFRWRQIVNSPIGLRTVEHEGTLPPNVEEAVASLIGIAKQLAEERNKLQAFKDWVHKYLDDHSVPNHPPGTHGAAGCRIGDRMDWLVEQLDAANRRANAAETLCSNQKQMLEQRQGGAVPQVSSVKKK